MSSLVQRSYRIDLNSAPERRISPLPPSPPVAKDCPDNGMSYPFYRTTEARLKSFENWPKSMPIKSKSLVEAGFYYLGYGDFVTCYFCGGGLKEWEANDDPWVEHAREFPHCEYVRMIRGKKFIDDVLSKRNLQSFISSSEEESIKSEDNKSNSLESSPTSSDEEESKCSYSEKSSTSDRQQIIEKDLAEYKKLKDEKSCKICFLDEVSVVFVPCGHLVTCPKCSLSVTTCPICREKIQSRLKTYLS